MTHLSLCSGIGGLDLAAEWAGLETVAQCEIDAYASKVLAKNFPGVPNLHDIRTVTNERLADLGIRTPTVISAGFPCQPYSLAGKGLGDRDDRDLWGEVARVVGEIRPRWFVGENTPGLFARSNQRYFRRVLDDLVALGYSVGWGIWGACDVGAPHKRQRVFIIANKNSDATFKRFVSDEIQRGVPSQGRNEENKRRVRPCGVQPFGICSSPSGKIDWWQVEPDVGGSLNGFSERLDKVRGLSNEAKNRANSLRALSFEAPSYYAKGWADGSWESGIERVSIIVDNRVDRLRCLGNAVVPQQAYPIFKAIAEFEEGKYD